MKTLRSSLLSLSFVSFMPVSFLILSNAFLISSSFLADSIYSLSILKKEKGEMRNWSLKIYIILHFVGLFLFCNDFLISLNLLLKIFKYFLFFLLWFNELLESSVILYILIQILILILEILFLLLSFFLKGFQLLFCSISIVVCFSCTFNGFLNILFLVF